MNQANRERANCLVQTELPEHSIHPTNGSRAFGVAMRFRFVPVGMGVDVISMHVRMGVEMYVRVWMQITI